MTSWSDKEQAKRGGGFAAKVASAQTDLLQLVTGKDSTGRNAWYFLMVENKQKLTMLGPALKTRTVDLTEFGEIVESGYGDEPPQEVTDRIKEKYGIK